MGAHAAAAAASTAVAPPNHDDVDAVSIFWAQLSDTCGVRGMLVLSLVPTNRDPTFVRLSRKLNGLVCRFELRIILMNMVLSYTHSE